jgi:type VI secretion system protein ImpG
MRESLLVYYEQELRFLRTQAMEFAEKYPEEAGRLLLESTRSDDPHVERLIEAFALMAARVRLKIDEDFPEISDTLLGILYPHYLAPIPSLSVAQLTVDPGQGKVDAGVSLARGTELSTRAVDAVQCQFRTAYPVTLWPVEITGVEIVAASALAGNLPEEARSALTLHIRSVDGSPLGGFALDPLRVFIDADGGLRERLHELFFLDAIGLHGRRGTQGPGRVLPLSAIRPLGLAEDEGLLDYPLESFVGYRLLQEFFAFPEKFMFAELTGMSEVRGDPEANEAQVSILLRTPLSELELRPSPENFRLGCTPVVNLFPMRADPIRIEHRTHEYRVTPDQRSIRSYEVSRVLEVTSTRSGEAARTVYQPLYSLRHGQDRDDHAPFWVSARRDASRRDDQGTDVYLMLVDESFSPAQAVAEVLHVRALCTNRDLPSRLPFGDAAGDLFVEGRAEVSRIGFLRKPSACVRAPSRDGARWRLVSHLSLNYLSLAGGLGEVHGPSERSDGLPALREVLRLYDFSDNAATRHLIEGIVGLRARRVVRRVRHEQGSGFARGLEVSLDFDESLTTATGTFLFASVLERFLGLYSSINSFTQTVAHSPQRGEIKRWPPRAGEQHVL